MFKGQHVFLHLVVWQCLGVVHVWRPLQQLQHSSTSVWCTLWNHHVHQPIHKENTHKYMYTSAKYWTNKCMLLKIHRLGFVSELKTTTNKSRISEIGRGNARLESDSNLYYPTLSLDFSFLNRKATDDICFHCLINMEIQKSIHMNITWNFYSLSYKFIEPRYLRKCVPHWLITNRFLH